MTKRTITAFPLSQIQAALRNSRPAAAKATRIDPIAMMKRRLINILGRMNEVNVFDHARDFMAIAAALQTPDLSATDLIGAESALTRLERKTRKPGQKPIRKQ